MTKPKYKGRIKKGGEEMRKVLRWEGWESPFMSNQKKKNSPIAPSGGKCRQCGSPLAKSNPLDVCFKHQRLGVKGELRKGS